MGCFYGPGGHGDSDGNRCREKRGRSDKLFLPLPLVTLRYVSDILHVFCTKFEFDYVLLTSNFVNVNGDCKEENI